MQKSSSVDNAAEGSTAPNDVYCPDVDTSNVDERKLMRRIDLHVIPWLAFVYLLNFLDRGSIGNAKVIFFFFVLPPADLSAISVSSRGLHKYHGYTVSNRLDGFLFSVCVV